MGRWGKLLIINYFIQRHAPGRLVCVLQGDFAYQLAPIKFGDILYLPATSSMCSLQLSDLELKTTKFRKGKGIHLQDKYNWFEILALGNSH